MPDITVSEAALRALMKDALADALDARRDLLREVVAEALEDAALGEAIRAGRDTLLVSRDDVFGALGGDSA